MMMATHLCQSPKSLNWEQIKQCVLGRQRSSDNYICGGCSRTFETICCLHVHCMKHNGGGSYYFDHVTSTAFPKFDTTCSDSDCNAEGLEVTQGQKFLTGHPVLLDIIEEDKGENHLQEADGAESELGVTSDGDSFKHIENDSSGQETEHKETSGCEDVRTKDFVEETEIEKKGKEKEGFVVVKVRNIERREDGSITFEMNEDDAHLFHITANTIINQMKENGETLLERVEVLEVLVPVGSVPETEIAAKQPSTNITDNKQVTGEPNRHLENHSIVLKTHTKTTQNTDCVEPGPRIRKSVVPEVVADSQQLKRNTKFNSSSENATVSALERNKGLPLHGIIEETEKFGGFDNSEDRSGKDDSRDFNTGLEGGNKTDRNMQNMTKASKKQEIIENLNLTPIDTVHVTRMGKRGQRTYKTDLEKGHTLNSNIQIDNVGENIIRKRPVRDRKLTLKMKESKLSEAFKLTQRKRELNIGDVKDKKKSKTTDRKGQTDESKSYEEIDQIKSESDNHRQTVVNDLGGNVKRYGTKPCPKETLLKSSTTIEFNLTNGLELYSDVSSSMEQKEVDKVSKGNMLGLGKEKTQLNSEIEVTNTAENQSNDYGVIEKSKSKVKSDKFVKSATATVKATLRSDKLMELAEHEKQENKRWSKNKNNFTHGSSEEQLFDSDADSDSMQVGVVVVKKTLDNLRRKQRSKRLETGKVPLYKRNDFECEVCGKVGSISMIKYHQQMHSNKMPFKCEECGKCFKTAACKRGHVRQHGEKKWKCDQCPAAFFRKQYLEIHMTKHTGEMPFMCELCGMKFRMAYIVRRHINNVHKNIRDYKCDICEKTFFRASTRDEHLKRHLEPYLQCSYCPKKFKAEIDIRKHELTHTGEKQFFCPLCNQGFTQIWPYYRHMWKIHSIQKDEAKSIRIKNPDIVHMRNINKDKVKKDPGYVHEFIGKPGCTFDMRKSFSQNVRKNSKGGSESEIHGGTYEYTKGSGVSTVAREKDDANAVYMETGSDLTDAIVLDVGEDFGAKETIVIQTEDLQNADQQQTGYIVVEDTEDGGSIVIYSEFPQNEMDPADNV